MSNNHTPGPWTITGDFVTTSNKDKKIIAQTFGDKDSSFKWQCSPASLENTDNMALIQNTPELYAFAKEIEKTIMKSGHNLCSTASENEQRTFINSIINNWNEYGCKAVKTPINNHTPGPWIITGSYVSTSGENKKIVAKTFGTKDSVFEWQCGPACLEGAENIKLISAATELYELAKSIESTLEKHMFNIGNGASKEDRKEFISEIINDWNKIGYKTIDKIEDNTVEVNYDKLHATVLDLAWEIIEQHKNNTSLESSLDALDKMQVVGDNLTKKLSAFGSFHEMTEAAENGYRPSIYPTSDEHKALADLYDYSQKITGRKIRCFTGEKTWGQGDSTPTAVEGRRIKIKAGLFVSKGDSQGNYYSKRGVVINCFQEQAIEHAKREGVEYTYNNFHNPQKEVKEKSKGMSM